MHTGEKPFRCLVCGEAFNCNGKLTSHMIIHNKERPHECEVCGRKFKRSSELRDHRKIHTGEKDHACDICGSTFIQKSNLVNHRKRHLNDYKFYCVTCSKGFYTSTELQEHQNIHTGVQLKQSVKFMKNLWSVEQHLFYMDISHTVRGLGKHYSMKAMLNTVTGRMTTSVICVAKLLHRRNCCHVTWLFTARNDHIRVMCAGRSLRGSMK
ncbi:zinc finger protein 528-like [Zootermopsis nevadensis]|uniref:zinc finger protein 528-like n=1 Tax=Zootermopsis nevadensis TaxID=136037 RepID=UPI000B8EB0F0|nr:zinc finger protein 528-like [Zootermopsis nevadensis]